MRDAKDISGDQGSEYKEDSRLHRILPILHWTKNYDRIWLRPDLIAGITVAAFAVPEALAYASLAGLNPEFGFYAMMIAALVYFVFGTSRQLSVGPTSALSILVATTLSTIAINDPGRYAALAAFTGLLVGLFALAAFILKLGFIAKLISSAVLTGFTAGVAFYIAANQLPRLLGIEGVAGGFLDKVLDVLLHLGSIHLPTFIMGLGGIVAMVVLERTYRKIPAALVVLIAAILLMSLTSLEDLGIQTVGSLPAGLPPLILPIVPETDIPVLLELALACFLVAYVEHMGASKTFARQNRYRVNDNQELLALGASNVANSFFQGYVVGGTYSRSAVADETGAKTQLASGVTGLMMGVIILLFSGFLSNLPEAILAAIVIVAVSRLVHIGEFRRLYRISRRQFVIAAAAFVGVLAAGLLIGVLIGLTISVLDLLDRIYRPRVDILGRLPRSDVFTNIEEHPENKQLDEILVLKVNHSILFFNEDNIRESVVRILRAQSRPIILLVLELESSPIIDIDGADMLADLESTLKKKGIDLRLAGLSNSAFRTVEGVGLKIQTEPDSTIQDEIQSWKGNGKAGQSDHQLRDSVDEL